MPYKNLGIYPVTLLSRVDYIPAESLYKGKTAYQMIQKKHLQIDMYATSSLLT